jgi:multidrug efflux system membrane fusion protein
VRAIAILLVAVACGRVEGSAGFERPPAPVSIATADSRDVPFYLDAIGKAAARETVSIQPQVGGRITKIHFQDGADVKRGDALFTIDPRPYQAALDSASASLAQNRAVLELAKLEFSRMEKLLETRAASQQEFDSKKNAVAVAQAQLAASQAAIETARLNLDHSFIRAPIDGRTGQRLVDVGNVVAANGPALVVIQRLDPIYADFTIPETELSGVQKSLAAGAAKVEVRLPDDGQDARQGSLTFLDNAVQEGTGTVKLRATLANSDHRFWPGRFVQVRLLLGTDRHAVLVPATAPQQSAKGMFVYVVKDDQTAELRPVAVGQRQGEQVVVESGVKAGERVVTAGQLAVMPGGKVRLADAPAQAAGPPGQTAPGTKP